MQIFHKNLQKYNKLYSMLNTALYRTTITDLEK